MVWCGGGGSDVGGGDQSTWTQSITVHYYNSNNWATVNAYSWDGAGAQFLGAWAGKEMEAEGDNWYKVTYNIDPNAVASLGINFSNGANSEEKTGDVKLTGLTNNEAWIMNDIAYNTKAEAEGGKNRVNALIGSDWTSADKGWEERSMTPDTSYTDGQKFTYTTDLRVGQQVYFHVGSDYPKSFASGGDLFDYTGSNGNPVAKAAGSYTFTLIYNNGTVTIDVVKA